MLLACLGLGWTVVRRQRSAGFDHAFSALLPRMTWLLLAWCALVLVFYVVNNTHVQTRYLLVLGPGLTIVAWSALMRRWRARVVMPWLVLAMLATSPSPMPCLFTT